MHKAGFGAKPVVPAARTVFMEIPGFSDPVDDRFFELAKSVVDAPGAMLLHGLLSTTRSRVCGATNQSGPRPAEHDVLKSIPIKSR